MTKALIRRISGLSLNDKVYLFLLNFPFRIKGVSGSLSYRLSFDKVIFTYQKVQYSISIVCYRVEYIFLTMYRSIIKTFFYAPNRILLFAAS